MTQNFCTNCGAPNTAGNPSCTACGAAFAPQSPAAPPAAPPADQGQWGQQPQWGQPPAYGQQPQWGQPPAHGQQPYGQVPPGGYPQPTGAGVNKNLLIGIGGLVLILVLVGASLLVFRGGGIEGTIKDYFSAYDNRDCKRLEDLVTSEDDSNVDDEVERCENSDGDSDDTEVEVESVKNIDKDGDTATADVKIKVSSDGEDSQTFTLTYGLKKVDGDWKIDLDHDPVNPDGE